MINGYSNKSFAAINHRATKMPLFTADKIKRSFYKSDNFQF